MVEIWRSAPQVFDGYEIYDNSEPITIVSEPTKCGADLMEVVDGMDSIDARTILSFCEISGGNQLVEDGGVLEFYCPTKDCGVVTTIRNQNGTIVASANPGCVSAEYAE